jgi:hypothetical protein
LLPGRPEWLDCKIAESHYACFERNLRHISQPVRPQTITPLADWARPPKPTKPPSGTLATILPAPAGSG